MSAIKVLFHLMKTHAPLVAVIPAGRIFPSLIPLGATLPAIAYSLVSETEQTSLGLTTMLVRSRVQVTVAVKGIDTPAYASVRSIVELIKTACNHKQGVFNGIITNSVIRESVGADFRDDTAEISYSTIDFQVDTQE